MSKASATFDIPYYHDYISPSLAQKLIAEASNIAAIPGLQEVGRGGGLETTASLQFLVDLYQAVKPKLAAVLAQRIVDRKFIDERVKACHEYNQRLCIDTTDSRYKTIIGLEDAHGRIVIGPKTDNYCREGGKKIAPVPPFMQGPHVTLFGPPDSAKMAVNAMNAYHRKLPGEPPMVEQLLKTQKASPTWGADDEDSKTPLRQDLIDAAVNLTACFDGKLAFTDADSGKRYALAEDHLAAPMKRFPGLALPSTFLFYKGNPIPLHLYDFALHLFQNWHNPKALVFYVPKLENEEEAAYIHHMIHTAEAMIKEQHSSYELGTVRVMIVLENPRAILRTHEIMDALHPYFIGASLGWHDYLASTARLLKEDSNYRIPVKADPNIVIKYIKASHSLLADVVGSRGGIKVGGMYGLLPLQADIKSPSFQVTLKGFFKDIIIQLKRDLTGFWVAHPDFVRLGLAIVEGWHLYKKGDEQPLMTLVRDILQEPYRLEVERFIRSVDVEGLDKKSPHYVRSLLAADIKESDFIANNHPDEIRYNVFQSLQYITDWLSGNGCVALPTIVEGIPVRVMDDLATAERSRWEVWHEIYHGRFAVEDFMRIAHEEYHFIRKDLSNDQKIVQVKWNDRTAKWYPIAFKLMIQLMTAKKPVEFASELLLPFTVSSIRDAQDPWSALQAVDLQKFAISDYLKRFDYYFERCGSQRFATTMAQRSCLDLAAAKNAIHQFSIADICDAASFHGDIGAAAKTLDAMATKEQSKVLAGNDAVLGKLRTLGERYLTTFGFKFLVSAQGRSAEELLTILEKRLTSTLEAEIQAARDALWEITQKRLMAEPLDETIGQIDALLIKHQITGAAVAIQTLEGAQHLNFGYATKKSQQVQEHTLFEIASLSKPVAAAFALEYFAKNNICLSTPVHQLFAKAKSDYRLTSKGDPSWADSVTVADLMSHSALNLHYVKGFPASESMPSAKDLLTNPKTYGYELTQVVTKPGTQFQYAGGGFIVLEHLLECLTGKSIQALIRPWLQQMGLDHFTFDQTAHDVAPAKTHVSSGYLESGNTPSGGRLNFPACAAGALASARDTMKFFRLLGEAYHRAEGVAGISHDTAALMLQGKDIGSRAFMGCDMGLGIFVVQAGDNRLMLHQGANDGFRALFLHTYSGPDRGKGFVILCNADQPGVTFIAEVAQLLLQQMKFSGVQFEKFSSSFDGKNITQEHLVNRGYKELIFDAFEPMRAEEIIVKGPKDPWAGFNLAANSLVLRTSNDRFARAENLVSTFDPIFDPELFGKQGKIMDSWESVRHNPLDRDTLELKLPKASAIKHVRLSTKFHDGNQAPLVRLLGRTNLESTWQEFLPETPIGGHSFINIKLPKETQIFAEIRVEMIPDGGLSRMGLYHELPGAIEKEFLPLGVAKSARFNDPIPHSRKPLTIPYVQDNKEIAANFARVPKEKIDYASLAFGGKLLHATNQHYGPAIQVISPFPPIHMFDGLESARSRDAGHFEEVTIELGRTINLSRIEMDFSYFTNNNPREVSVDAWIDAKWTNIVPVTNAKAFAANRRIFKLANSVTTGKIKVRTYPDGGINRIRAFQ